VIVLSLNIEIASFTSFYSKYQIEGIRELVEKELVNKTLSDQLLIKSYDYEAVYGTAKPVGSACISEHHDATNISRIIATL